MHSPLEWSAEFGVGHEAIDAEHQCLLAQCGLLAEVCAGEDEARSAQRFDQAVECFKDLVRQHFQTETTLRAEAGDPDLDGHRFELDEFEHLAGEVATTPNFERPEIQRFLSLWCVGHVRESAQRLRGLLGDRSVPNLRQDHALGR